MIDPRLLMGIQTTDQFKNIQDSFDQGKTNRGRLELSKFLRNANPDMSEDEKRKSNNQALSILGGYDPEAALNLSKATSGRPATGNFLLTQQLRESANEIADDMETIAQEYVSELEKVMESRDVLSDISQNDFRLARDIFRSYEPAYNRLQNKYVRLTGKRHVGAWDTLRSDLALIDREDDDTRDAKLSNDQFQFGKKKEFDSIKSGALRVTSKLLDAYGLITGAISQWNKAFDSKGKVVNPTSLNGAIKMWVRSLDNSVVNAGELQGLTDSSLLNTVSAFAEKLVNGVGYTEKDLQSFKNSIQAVIDDFIYRSTMIIETNLKSAVSRLNDLGYPNALQSVIDAFGFSDKSFTYDKGVVDFKFPPLVNPIGGSRAQDAKATTYSNQTESSSQTESSNQTSTTKRQVMSPVMSPGTR